MTTPSPSRTPRLAWEHLIGAAGLVLILYGQHYGLFRAPPERMMGDVARILYVHVPVAWITLLGCFVAFVAALGYLLTSRRGFDWMVEASVEVSAAFGVALLATGAIFARPTWGVFWTWDPRLTTAAVLELSLVGVLLLRSVVLNPERRATWSAVATVMASINAPITYMSVRWWRSMHQMQSTTDTLSPEILFAWKVNVVAITLIGTWILVRRWRLARHLSEAETPEPLQQEVPT